MACIITRVHRKRPLVSVQAAWNSFNKSCDDDRANARKLALVILGVQHTGVCVASGSSLNADGHHVALCQQIAPHYWQGLVPCRRICHGGDCCGAPRPTKNPIQTALVTNKCLLQNHLAASKQADRQASKQASKHCLFLLSFLSPHAVAILHFACGVARLRTTVRNLEP